MAETYLGRACKRCGCEEKYVSNKGCIECNKNHTLTSFYKKQGKKLDLYAIDLYREKIKAIKYAREKGLLYPPERQEAKENGKKYYTSKTCVNCGTNRRYVKNNQCCVCATNKNKRLYEQRKIQKQKAA